MYCDGRCPTRTTSGRLHSSVKVDRHPELDLLTCLCVWQQLRLGAPRRGTRTASETGRNESALRWSVSRASGRDDVNVPPRRLTLEGLLSVATTIILTSLQVCMVLLRSVLWPRETTRNFRLFKASGRNIFLPSSCALQLLRSPPGSRPRGERTRSEQTVSAG